MKSKLVNVITYIEEHIDEELSLIKLSEQANLSKYHFHRCFSAAYGMTIIKYVLLIRLKKAAHQLAYRYQKNILEIALSNGFESQEGFSRAFKKFTGQTPNQFRQQPNWQRWEELQQPLNHIKDKAMLDKLTMPVVEIVHFETINIAVMDHLGPPHLVGNTVREFIHWRKEHKLPPANHRTFNLLYDDPEATNPEDYRFGLAVEIKRKLNNSQENINFTALPNLRCAKISHHGSDDELGMLVKFLYQTWLSGSGEQPADFPIFFERKSFFPDVPIHQANTDIYLPLL